MGHDLTVDVSSLYGTSCNSSSNYSVARTIPAQPFIGVISSGWFSYRVARKQVFMVSVIEEKHSILKDVGYQVSIPASGKVLKLSAH